MVSVVATLQTQLFQCTRLLFSMARDQVIGEPMGWLHPRFQTPWLAGIAVAAVSLLLFAASATVPSIKQLMSNLINAIGVQVSFYYALAGIACVWYYRNVLFTGWRMLVFAGIVPLTSALFVASVGIYQLPQLGFRVSIMSIGTILIGIVPLCFIAGAITAASTLTRRNPPELGKRHDDRIDGEGIALNIYFLDRRIEFGAYGSFHFHRLDDAEGFAGPDPLPGGHGDRFDEARHRTSQKIGTSPSFSLA